MTTQGSLSKTFPHLDKVCDAVFLKKATAIPTKKDTVRFILDNADCRAFFSVLENEMIGSDAAIQEKISKYFTTVPQALDQFKKQLKVARANIKITKQQMDRDAIKAELRREMEQEAKTKVDHAKTRSELNLPEEPISVSSSSSASSSSIPTPKKTQFDDSSTEPELIGGIPAPEVLSESQPDQEMDLDDFYKYFKETLNLGLISIKSPTGQTLTVQQIEFDHQKITLVVGSPPVVTPKPAIRLPK